METRKQILLDHLPRLTCRNLLTAIAAGYTLIMIPIIAVNDGVVSDGNQLVPGWEQKNPTTDFVADLDRQVEVLRSKTETLGKLVAELDVDRINSDLLKIVHRIKHPFVSLHQKLFADLGLLTSEKPATFPTRTEQEFLSRYEENVRLLKLHTDQLKNRHEKYRRRVLKELGDRVQQRIYQQQHPENCSATRKLICDLNKNCGFGCQIHHALLCLIASLALDRTMILQSRPWSYSPNGWEKFFLPVTDCVDAENGTSLPPVFTSEKESLHLPAIKYPFFPLPTPDWTPFAVPKDILPNISLLHEQPSLWWIGQGLTYLWRLQPNLRKKLEEEKRQMGFKKPVVGIHVRRTDKLLREARLHSIQSYAGPAEDYWLQMSFLQKKPPARQIFLASDDARVLRDFQRKYGHRIKIYGRTNGTKSSASMQTRYTEKSLLELIRDIYFLSNTDFLVCTFSSLICKLAHELKQYKEDATKSFTSLDDSYWFPGSRAHLSKATRSNVPLNASFLTERDDEIYLQNGDIVSGTFNLWTGYSVGTNTRTGLKGRFPTYKVQDVEQEARFSLLSIVTETS